MVGKGKRRKSRDEGDTRSKEGREEKSGRKKRNNGRRKIEREKEGTNGMD